MIEGNETLSGRMTDAGHELLARVYYADTDFSGAVYHGRYLEFLERGRSDFLRVLGVHHTDLQAGHTGEPLFWVVKRMEIDFVAPARIDDVLTISTRVAEPGKARIRMAQEIRRGGALLIAATCAVLHAQRQRFRALIYISVIGLVISLAFVHFSAPDLALTQISVEVVTIILLLLALNFLPNTTPNESGALRRTRDAIIAGAGGAAHLPGMMASKTRVPVIGVPVQTKALSGVDSLYSIVQMPRGFPVATMAIGAAGAANAALMAAGILALQDPALAARLDAWRDALSASIPEEPSDD